MPDTLKLFGQLKHALLGAVVIIGLLSGSTRAGDWPLGPWPLVLPTDPFGVIPSGQGMDFFLGKWRQGGSRPQGGPMIITKNTLEYPEDSDFGYQYRVIHETPNYVLVVARVVPYKLEYEIPTQFMMFTAQSFGDPVTRETELRRHTCRMGIWGTFEAFDWPAEKLMATFKKSLCLSIIDIDGTVSTGWGNSLHIRVGAWD